jgi:hypothetical protein
LAHSLIPQRRLTNQALTGTPLRRPEDVVGWFGAVQAQEFEPAKWGLALRMRDGTSRSIGRAFDEATVLGIGAAFEAATNLHLRRPSLDVARAA